MKIVRCFLVAAAVLLAAPALTFAQDQGGGPGGGRGRGGRGMNMAEQLKDTLNLTDDQVAKVKAIEDEMREEFQKLRDEMQNGGDWQQMREKMQPLREKSQEKVRAILTAEQKPKFEEWIKQQDERMKQRMDRGPGGPGGPGGFGRRGPSDKDLLDRAEKELTLTGDEKAAVLPLVKKVLESRTAAREASQKRREELQKFLKDTPGSTEGQKAEIATKLKEIRKNKDADDAKIKEAQDGLREVLTPENEAKLMAMGILD